MTAALTFRLYSTNTDRLMTSIAERPPVERETAYYLENIGSVRSIDDFMADRRLVDFALTAYGLEDMAYAKAFIRTVLEEGVDSADALANPQVFRHQCRQRTWCSSRAACASRQVW